MKRLLMLMSVATMMATAAPAYADPRSSDNDADFLKQLTAAGLTYQDPDAAIAVAKDVCDLVDKGTPDTDIVKNLQLRNPQFTGTGAAKFTSNRGRGILPQIPDRRGSAPETTWRSR